MKTYRAGHSEDYNWFIWIRDENGAEEGVPFLALYHNRDVSPSYGDGGISDCAVSILAHHFGETKEQIEASFYEDQGQSRAIDTFSLFVPKLKREHWATQGGEITSEEIDEILSLAPGYRHSNVHDKPDEQEKE